MLQAMTAPTFLWHDYETFGANPRRDCPPQFAAVRTDAELNEVGAPFLLYCQPPTASQPPLGRAPEPDACLATGITPRACLTKGSAPEEDVAAN